MTATTRVRVLIALACLACNAYGDDAVDNGAVLQSSPAQTAEANSVEISINAGWSATASVPPAFFWIGEGEVFNREGPFTFSSDEPVVVCVTDVATKGDAFAIYDLGELVGVTTLVPIAFTTTGDPIVAVADQSYSSGAVLLPPGDHAVTIKAVVNPFGGGRGYLRVDTLEHAPQDCLDLLDISELIAFAGSDQTLECHSADGAVTMLSGGALNPGSGSLSFKWCVPDSVLLEDDTDPFTFGLFPIGITEATLTVSDDAGNIAIDTVGVTVVDTVPPEVACTTDLAALWPPEHQMVQVGVFIDATDACTTPDDLILLAVTASSNEPDDADGNGDGSTTGDTDGEDGHSALVDISEFFKFNPFTASFDGSVFLRAERAGGKTGRTYTIEATVLDSQNNLTTTSCVVVVPHDQSK